MVDLDPGTIVTTVGHVWPLVSFVSNRWWKSKMEDRFRMLTREIQRLSSQMKVLTPEYTESDEFHSLATRVVLAAARDHRLVKHTMLAAALVNSAGGCCEWSYDKKQLLVDFVVELEPYHVSILRQCPLPTSGPIHVHPWDKLASMPGLPEPKEDVLVNAIQKLSVMSLLTYWGGGHMTANHKVPHPQMGGRLEYVTYLPDVLKASRFARTRLADDFLAFLSTEPSDAEETPEDAGRG